MTDDATRDLMLDIAAADMLVRLYPAEVPSTETLRRRLARTPRWQQRERILLGAYLSIVEKSQWP